jgi:putative transposase
MHDAIGSRMRDRWSGSPRNLRLPVEAYRRLLRPCFLTIRAAHGTKPFADATLNQAVIDVLVAERLRAHCELYVYCLMPDHLHLIAAPGADGGCPLRFMREFKSRSTRIAWSLRRRGRLWQPGFFDVMLRTEESLRQTYWYVLANPVRAGLVREPEHYRWSGEPDPVPW